MPTHPYGLYIFLSRLPVKKHKKTDIGRGQYYWGIKARPQHALSGKKEGWGKYKLKAKVSRSEVISSIWFIPSAETSNNSWTITSRDKGNIVSLGSHLIHKYAPHAICASMQKFLPQDQKKSRLGTDRMIYPAHPFLSWFGLLLSFPWNSNSSWGCLGFWKDDYWLRRGSCWWMLVGGRLRAVRRSERACFSWTESLCSEWSLVGWGALRWEVGEVVRGFENKINYCLN